MQQFLARLGFASRRTRGSPGTKRIRSRSGGTATEDSEGLRQRHGCDDRRDRSQGIGLATKALESLWVDLARRSQAVPGMTRLDTIALRQKKTFSRDVLFAALVTLAAVVSIASVTTAIDTATLLVQR
ncbi:MAG: hypothetical protein SFX73_35680 [Kofleriaceae bacterium]|nr:hypothetical protein [Kofleriaceae bacterium]